MEKQFHGQASESLRLGLLLAVVGGFLEAYTFLSRGGVFANCETGNLVLLGLYLAQGQMVRAMTYLPPILAFFLRRTADQQHPPPGRLPSQAPLAADYCAVRGGLPGCSCFHPLRPLGEHRRHGAGLLRLLHSGAKLPQSTRQRICHHHVHRQPAQRRRQSVRRPRPARCPALLRASRYLSVVLVFVLGAVAGALTQALAEKAVLLCTLPLLAAFGVMFLPTGEAAP